MCKFLSNGTSNFQEINLHCVLLSGRNESTKIAVNTKLCGGVAACRVKQSRYRPGGSRKLRFPDFVTTAQDCGRLSPLRTGLLYSQEIYLVLFSVRG